MAAGVPRKPRPIKKKRRRDDDDDDFGDKDDKDDDNLEDDTKRVDSSIAMGPSGGKRGLLEASLAIGMASRTYELIDSQGTKVGKYKGAYYPEFVLGLQLYPLTLATRGWLSGLGLGLSYSRHLSISTEEKATGNSVDTSTQEIQANLRYRWLISNRLSGPQVYGLVGWGYHSFSLAENTILASFDYHYIHIGLGGRVPLGTPYLGISLEASVRPVLKVGQEAVNAYGERGGAFAFSVRPGLFGYVWKLRYFIEFEFARYGMDFKGLPAGEALPGTIDLELASDGSDVFLRTWAGLAYAY